MKKIIFVLALFLSGSIYAQRTTSFAEAAAGVAKFQGTLALSYVRLYGIGAEQKLKIGVGLRHTSYLGVNQYFSTAPAQLKYGSTSPLTIFQKTKDENIDTLLVKSSQINSLNLSFNIHYKFSKKITAGLSFDVLGFSYGKNILGNYINNPFGKRLGANPTSLNLFLIGDNNKGSLNSDLFIHYFLNDKWALKGSAQFLITEYTTVTKVQQLPEPNDLFRRKSLLFSLGVARYIR